MTAARDCPPPCVHPDNIISASQVRDLAGVRSRHTLLRWRENRGFPAPIRTVPGPGGPFELWDSRQVEAWLVRNQ